MSQSIVDTLIKAGFEPIVADIYLILINNGELSVPQILEHTTLSRASVYEALPELLAGGYIEYRKEGRQAFYKPAHPTQLASLVEQKKRDVALLDGEMGETIRALVGSYNLSSNKPGVRFFEGRDGFRDALEESLSATEPIYTYVNVEAIETYVNDINKAYVKKRQEKNIQKKILTHDTPKTREYLSHQKDSTDIKYLPSDMKGFQTGMQIYDGKISYFTVSEDSIVAVLIQDPYIYEMHKHMFEYLWNHAAIV